MPVTAITRRALPRRWAGVAAWALLALALLGLATVPWFDHLTRQAGRPELTQLNASTIPYLLAIVAAATVGAVLASRLPHHPVGWLLLALGLSVTGSGVADGYARYGLVARPGALPAARWVATYSPATTIAGLALVGFVLLLTPTGSLPSPRWRWWAWVAAAGPVVFVVALTVGPGLVIPPYESAVEPVTIPALAGAVLVAIVVGFVVTVGGLVVGAGSLVARFRHARGVERQQLRWLALAAALTGVGAAVVGVGMAMGATAVPLFAAGVCLMLLPLATGAAIQRYRLYDLDRIISRTLAYGLLTVLLGGGYAALVLGLGELIGRDSNLVVAAATLAVAAAFQPARRRVQTAVDRRFNRRRYDTAQTIAAFADRLRQQIDLDTLTAELLTVAGQTMQPTSVSLWLGPSPAHPRPAQHPAHPRAAK
jgi:MFS family permease